MRLLFLLMLLSAAPRPLRTDVPVVEPVAGTWVVAPFDFDAGRLVPASDAGAHQHCWHYSNLQHTVAWHEDFVCCLCGAHECRNIPHEDFCAGHGSFNPSCPRVFHLLPDGGVQ